MSSPNAKKLSHKTGFFVSTSTVLVVIGIVLFFLAVHITAPILQSLRSWQKKQNDYYLIWNNFLPSTGHKKTLLLFSNSAEQRFGGGFIGTVGLLNCQDGSISFSPMRSVYYYDHRINETLPYQLAPDYLQGLTDKLYLRDSGIYANWPRSAQLAAKMYEIESGIKPDNVVNITPLVLKIMLDQSGPINLPEYGLTINKDNILTTLQLEVEAGKDKKEGKDPKSILSVLAGKIVQSMANKKTIELYNSRDKFLGLFARKHISLYGSDEKIQKLIEEHNLSAGFSSLSGNLLQVASANYGADKSSTFISQSIKLHQIIKDDGTSVLEVKIKRTHNSDYAYPYIDPKSGNKWLVGENKTLNKIFVPKNAKLLSSSLGLNQTQSKVESNRQVFSYHMLLMPKSSQEVTVSYQLPFKYQMSESVTVGSLFEKQVGAGPDSIEYSLSLPAKYKLTGANRKDITLAGNSGQLNWRGILDSDRYLEFIYEKK